MFRRRVVLAVSFFFSFFFCNTIKFPVQLFIYFIHLFIYFPFRNTLTYLLVLFPFGSLDMRYLETQAEPLWEKSKTTYFGSLGSVFFTLYPFNLLYTTVSKFRTVSTEQRTNVIYLALNYSKTAALK